MTAPNYEIWLTTDRGVRLRSLDDALWFNCARQVNRIGWFTMGLPATFSTEQYGNPIDPLVQIWRAPTGGRLKLWRVYFLRGIRHEHSGTRERIMIWGPDSNDLLRRRIVTHYAGEAEANYTATEADDMMKDIMTNATTDGTNPAPDAGTRAWDNFSVAGDLTLGPQLDKGCAWKPLLTDAGGGVLAEIAEAAKEAGTEVFFDVVADSISPTSISFQFRTYTGQPGMDLTSSVVFSQQDKNLKDPYYEYDRGDEVNYVYAGGQGEEDEREIQQAYDAWRYGQSAWNRCEGFADARDQNSANGVLQAAYNALGEGYYQYRAGGVPIDTEGTRFGMHWDVGDKVTMQYKNKTIQCIVRAVVLRMNGYGEETIDARLEYES